MSVTPHTKIVSNGHSATAPFYMAVHYQSINQSIKVKIRVTLVLQQGRLPSSLRDRNRVTQMLRHESSVI